MHMLWLNIWNARAYTQACSGVSQRSPNKSARDPHNDTRRRSGWRLQWMALRRFAKHRHAVVASVIHASGVAPPTRFRSVIEATWDCSEMVYTALCWMNRYNYIYRVASVLSDCKARAPSTKWYKRSTNRWFCPGSVQSKFNVFLAELISVGSIRIWCRSTLSPTYLLSASLGIWALNLSSFF